MREDQDAHRARGLDEPGGGDRLAGRGRVAESVAADRAGILRRGELLLDLVLVDDAEVRVLLLGLRRLDRAVAVQGLLVRALVGGDQLGEHPGERVHLVAAQLGAGGEVRRLLREHALEAEHERESHLPL